MQTNSAKVYHENHSSSLQTKRFISTIPCVVAGGCSGLAESVSRFDACCAAGKEVRLRADAEPRYQVISNAVFFKMNRKLKALPQFFTRRLKAVS